MNMTDLEMDLLLAQAEVATLKRAAAGNMFTVPDDYVKVVRCEHCEYYVLHALACHNEHINGVMPIDGYCSYGKRKDGGIHG